MTLSASQTCRRTGAVGIRAFRGGLRVGGFEAPFRRRDGAAVIAARLRGCAGAGRISRKEKAARREDWKWEAGQPVRPGAECALSAFKQTFGGHVAARKWENVVKEVARKIAIHSAIPGDAGEPGGVTPEAR